jgi:predicted NBD/HSP70 family sugar kinase
MATVLDEWTPETERAVTRAAAQAKANMILARMAQQRRHTALRNAITTLTLMAAPVVVSIIVAILT